jgi:hypothetical protein
MLRMPLETYAERILPKDSGKVHYNLGIMPRFFRNWLRALRERRGTDMAFMCRHLLSERGEASQTALAQEIINAYRTMNEKQRLQFFEMLSHDFAPNEARIVQAAADYQRAPGPPTLAALYAAVESPRQELFRRINTAPRGTETLVALREHVLSSGNGNFAALDLDLKHLFRSWFNRGSCVLNASAGTHRHWSWKSLSATNPYMKLMAGRTCTGVWKPTGAALLSSTQP